MEALRAEQEQEQEPVQEATLPGRLRALFPGVLEQERGQGQVATLPELQPMDMLQAAPVPE